ncbi:hypothetical protein H0H92_007828, partial [Tricholoma furcatifolium]
TETNDISGTGHSYRGPLTVDGIATPVDANHTEVEFDIEYWQTSGFGGFVYDRIQCFGIFDASSSTITGRWDSQSSESDGRRGTFHLSRTPAPLVRFRYTSEEFAQNAAKARWDFARASILFMVRRDKMDKDHVRSVLREIRLFVELHVKNLYHGATQRKIDALSSNEERETLESAVKICPTIASFFYSLALDLLKILPYHPLVFPLSSIISFDLLSISVNAVVKDLIVPIRGDKFFKLATRALAPFPQYLAQPHKVSSLPASAQRKPERIVCDECDEKHQRMPPPFKMIRWTNARMKEIHAMHSMVWIRDAQEVNIPKEDQLARVEDRLHKVESLIREHLAMEQRVDKAAVLLASPGSDTRFTDESGFALERKSDMTIDFRAMSARLGSMEERISNIESRFDSMEALLRDFISKAQLV